MIAQPGKAHILPEIICTQTYFTCMLVSVMDQPHLMHSLFQRSLVDSTIFLSKYSGLVHGRTSEVIPQPDKNPPASTYSHTGHP